MKRFNLVSMVAVLVLLVTGVSCTTMTGTQDDYYSQQPARRVFVEDPYRGTIVLERDPYSGRYYEVNSYGSTYGRDPYYNNRNYRGNGYGRNRGNVYNDNRNRNNNTYRNNSPNRNTQQQATPQQTPEQKEAQKKLHEQNRQDARKKVLGN